MKYSIACRRRRTYAEQNISGLLALKAQGVWKISIQFPLPQRVNLCFPEPTKVLTFWALWAGGGKIVLMIGFSFNFLLVEDNAYNHLEMPTSDVLFRP